jgi:hypothetical protein
MHRTTSTGAVQAQRRSRHTMLRDCGVLAILALLCLGLEVIVNAAAIFLTWGPKWNTSAVQTTTTLEWLYLFVAPGVLLFAIVMRLLGVGLGKTSSFMIGLNVAWCIAIVVAAVVA